MLTSNGDCDENASFELGTSAGGVSNMLSYSDVATETGNSATLNSPDVGRH